MRRVAIGVMAAGLLIGLTAGGDEPKPADQAAIAAELKKFEGTWRYESTIVNGQPLPGDALESPRLVLKGDTFELSDPMVTYRGTFAVDPKAKPRTIDITMTEGPEKGSVMLGIYELDGDTYRICAAMSGPERPKEFTCKEGSGRMLHVLKRVKP